LVANQTTSKNLVSKGFDNQILAISNSLPKFNWQMLCFGKLLKEYAKLKRDSPIFFIFNLPKYGI